MRTQRGSPILVCIGAGWAIFTLLALGTFTAGVHILSYSRFAFWGFIMSLAIPAIAWIENSALFELLIGAGVIGIVAVF